MSYQEAMEAAGAEILAFAEFGSYQGEWLAKVSFEGKTGIIEGSYGSCSGCDAFEAEFGYGPDGCAIHRWNPDLENCATCIKADAQHREKLANFGRGYLDGIMTDEELARHRERVIEQAKWDSDAPAILAWLDANA